MSMKKVLLKIIAAILWLEVCFDLCLEFAVIRPIHWEHIALCAFGLIMAFITWTKADLDD